MSESCIHEIPCCNIGNLIADITCTTTKADCAIINSGTLRSDVVHDPGVFKLKVSSRYHLYVYESL